MSQRHYFASLSCAALTFFVLGGCATTQENPQYRYSSKLGSADESNVRYASAQLAPAPINQREVITTPQTYQQPASQYGVTPYTPRQATSQGYPLAGAPPVYEEPMVETGGQNGGENGAMMQVKPVQPTAALQPTQIYLPQAQTSERGYVATPAAGMMSYVVQEDDTVYNLSKRTCSTPNEIKAINNLDVAYTIRAGYPITLPAPRC